MWGLRGSFIIAHYVIKYDEPKMSMLEEYLYRQKCPKESKKDRNLEQKYDKRHSTLFVLRYFKKLN